jgi:hypothetical protein
VRDGPIASGDKVVAVEDFLAQHRASWPQLIGVEMEAGGVAAACFQAARPPGFLMVRGVSDHAEEAKGADDVEQWRAYACDVAASFLVALLDAGPITARAPVEPGCDSAPAPAEDRELAAVVERLRHQASAEARRRGATSEEILVNVELVTELERRAVLWLADRGQAKLEGNSATIRVSMTHGW